MQLNPVLWSEPLASDRAQLKDSIDADEEEDLSQQGSPTFEILEPNHSFLYSTISSRNLQVSKISFLNLSLPTTAEEEEEEIVVQLDGESKEINSVECFGEEKPTVKKNTPCKRISYKIKRSSSAYRKLNNRNPIRGTTVAELASKFDKLCMEKKFILDDPKFAQIIKRVNSQNYSQGDAGKINRKTSIKMNVDDRALKKPHFRQGNESDDVEHISVRAAIKIFEDRQLNDVQDVQLKTKSPDKKFSKSLESIPVISVTHTENDDIDAENKITNKNDDFEMPVLIVSIPIEKTIRSESAYEISHVKSKAKKFELDLDSRSVKSDVSQPVSPSQPPQENEGLYDLVIPTNTVVEKKIQPPVPPKPKNIERKKINRRKTESSVQASKSLVLNEELSELFISKRAREMAAHEKVYEELLIPSTETAHSYEDIEQKSDDGYEAIIPLNTSEQNIYETLPSMRDSPPPLPRRQEELRPPKLPSKNTYYKVHNQDEANSYEIIDTSEIFRTNIVSEVSSESSYDTLLQLKWNSSGSNRGSLISCDQQSNSLYGRSIPGWTEDGLNYKANSDSFSDRSDDWSDVDDNEGGSFPESDM